MNEYLVSILIWGKSKKNSIWSCCKEKQPYAGGYIWKYKK